MGEIRVNEVFMAGRISRRPTKTNDGLVHFLFDSTGSQPMFHCVCEGKTADNLLQYCESGDEISLEGELRWIDFPNTGKSLIIFVRYISYGRKLRTLRQRDGSN